MKIIIVVILLASISFNSFGQQNPKPGTKEFFVQKSEKQKRTGTTFLTLGLTSAGLGAVIAAMGGFDAAGVAVVFLGAGSIMTVVSIPILISAGSNKRRAANLTFRFDKNSLITPQGLSKNIMPSVGLRFNL